MGTPGQVDSPAPLGAEVAIRLADEGVPVRCISRAIHATVEELQPVFEQAKLHGKLVDLPRMDWPINTPRQHRVPDLRPIADIDDMVLKAAIMQVFRMTPTQAAMFLALIRRREISRDQMYTVYTQRLSDEVAVPQEKTLDVQLCKMRRALAKVGIEIKTLWGFGHCMTVPNRRKALNLILRDLGRIDVAIEIEE